MILLRKFKSLKGSKIATDESDRASSSHNNFHPTHHQGLIIKTNSKQKPGTCFFFEFESVIEPGTISNLNRNWSHFFIEPEPDYFIDV